tara:strand:- start:124 stop:396 length:273 start_codon:yes stop_codon:yes gene_type:complete
MIIYILIPISIMLLYCTLNLFRKLERSDDTVLELLDTHQELKRRIASTIETMKTIDSKGGFQAEDEVGAIFDALKRELETLEEIYDIIED